MQYEENKALSSLSHKGRRKKEAADNKKAPV
jgi:hypothetical protein